MSSPPPPKSNDFGEKFEHRLSDSVRALLNNDDRSAQTTGSVIAQLLTSHRSDYLDSWVAFDGVDALGPSRTVLEQVKAADSAWDMMPRVPLLTGRHVVLGLAIDAILSWRLLHTGVIASMLERWRPGLGTKEEPHRLVWDLLKDESRARVDEFPLLAAAFGAGADWTAEFPQDVIELAFSPDGEKVAALCGSRVVEAGPSQGLRDINDVEPGTTSLGWAGRGVVALQINEGTARLMQVSTKITLGTISGILDGRISGDGSQAWLESSSGVVRWSPTNNSAPIGPPSQVMAVDSSAEYGLLLRGESDQLLVSDAARALPPTTPVTGQPNWPEGFAGLIGWNPIPSAPAGPRALVWVGRRPAVPVPDGSGVVIATAPSPPLARLATGAGEVTALASDPSGTQVAVAVGRTVRICRCRGSDQRREASRDTALTERAVTISWAPMPMLRRSRLSLRLRS